MTVNLLRFVGLRWGLVALGHFDRNDEIELALRSLVGTIDATRMREMNRAVDEQGQTPAHVAARLLDSLER